MDLEQSSNDTNTELAASGAPVLDLDRYRPMVESEFDSPDDAEAFLRALWFIMCAFVDLGWGVNSIHFAFPELVEISTPDQTNALQSADQKTIEEEVERAFADPSRLEDS